jgi:putative membrane protein
MSRALILAGAVVLLLAWVGPLPGLVPLSFAAHMALHMSVVGVGVPLLSIGLAPRLQDRAAGSARVLPIVVSVLDFIVVWGWHTPVLHHLSRTDPLMLALEQASFAAIALLVWLVAFTGPALAGAMTLFFTSMHMTLLGALIGLASRPIYPGHHHRGSWLGLDAVADQHLGGVIMLAIGGVIYLGGGILLAARVLRRPVA